MDLFQLETFLAVSEERSFSRAATRLHRTQPAVSQAIAKLEAELGEVLLERSSRDGTLTDAGEVLREYAVKLLNLRGEAAGALNELRELHRGRLEGWGSGRMNLIPNFSTLGEPKVNPPFAERRRDVIVFGRWVQRQWTYERGAEALAAT